MLVLVSDRDRELHLHNSYWDEKSPRLGRKMTITGEDPTVDEPGRIGAVLSTKTRDFVLAHWNTGGIENILELVRAGGKAKERKG